MNSKILAEVMAANATYVMGFGEKGQLALPPARRFAILTCMDARLDPAKYAAYPKATRMSSAMLAGVRQMTPFARSLSRTNCLERRSGLSSITQIAAWSFSLTM
jgi:hypothetical protein